MIETVVTDTVMYQDVNRFGHPMEDYALVSNSRRAFAVADGVTRDLYPDGGYPGESGAAEAAKIFCQNVVAHLEQYSSCDGDGSLRRAFDEANWRILELNERYGMPQRVDFLGNDYFGAVGAAATLCEEDFQSTLRYGFVGDCRVMAIGAEGEKRLETPDEVDSVHRYMETVHFPSKQEASRFVRSFLRNSAEKVVANGRVVSYGVFTGEREVRHYYRFGKIPIREDDVILLFSDGLAPIYSTPAFQGLLKTYLRDSNGDKFREHLSELCCSLADENPREFGDDKTLLLVRI